MRFAFFLLLLASITLAVDVPDVKLSILSTPASATPGSSFTVQVQATNNGVGAATLVRIYPDVSKPFSIKEGTNTQALADTLGYGRSLTTDFSFSVSPDALSDTYKFKVFVEYQDANKNMGKVSQEVSINVAGTPLIELMGVSLPGRILPGDTDTLQVTIRNIGTANARNVRVMFANISDPSVKASGNPVAYLENAPAGSEKAFSLSFSVDGKALAKAYSLPIIVSYQDKDGKDYSLLRTASMRVESQIVLEVLSSNTEPLVKGIAGTIGVTIANSGQHNAEFLKMDVTTAGAYPPQTYVGTLESDDYSTVDVKITPNSTGRNRLGLSLSYRDQYNQESTIERSLDYQVISAEELAKAQPVSAMSYAAPALIVLLVLYFIYRRIKK